MKPLNAGEVENLVEDLKDLLGARLQEIQTGGRELGLGLYHKADIHWVWIDMNPTSPMLLRLERAPKHLRERSPLSLFLKAHGKNLNLREVLQPLKAGRILSLLFGPDSDPLTVEIRLFPHGENIIVEKSNKRVSYAKVQELKPLKESPLLSVRSLSELKRQWLGPVGPVKTEDAEARKQSALRKKREGLEKLKQDSQAKQKHKLYSELGEWLKEHQTLKVPVHLKDILAINESLATNIEKSFTKAKQLKHRWQESQKRIEKLEAEITAFEARPALTGAPDKTPNLKSTKKSEAKFRTLRLESNLEAYMGKSGRDNLTLLREAQPWDLWLHLRDLPGAHVVVRRPKKLEVTDDQIRKVTQWLVRETASKKFSPGDFVEIQLQEVRFVRPIKGDRLGRVTVQDPKFRRLRLPSD